MADELEDDFLDDLDELGDDSGDDSGSENSDEEAMARASASNTAGSDGAIVGHETSLYNLVSMKGIENIAQLRRSTKFTRHIADIAEVMVSPGSVITGTLESDRIYKLVILSNSMIQNIDEEITNIHRYIAELYSKKFVELESLIQNKIDYIKAIKRVGNETDMTLVELSDILPSALVMVVSVTGSTSNGTKLSGEDYEECMKSCDEALQLDVAKGTILSFVESRMTRIAPNTCYLIGARVAAHLVGLAGGLDALSKIPSCNVQVMGQEKKHLSGFSNIAAMPHSGVLYYAEAIQRCPPALRRKALKKLAGKVAITSRIDAYNNSHNGEEGQRIRREFDESMDKLMEPAKARTKKALPIPEEKKKNKRGGKRVRRWKERFAMTDLRQQQNRIIITTTEGEYGDSAMGVTQGIIGSHNTGKVRAATKKEVHLAKKQKVVNMSSGQTNGLSSSLVFTPVQGIELVNPNAAADRVKEANKKWFNSSSGFLSAVPK